MSYQKHNWVKNEIIRAKQLNHIEDGIYEEEQRARNVEEILDAAITNEESRATNIESQLDNSITLLGENKVNKTDKATTSALGLVKPDGTTITIDSSGTIHASGTTIAIDDELSDVSENPVMNRVLTAALDDKADSADLSEVATSGDYDDLSNKPTVPGGVKVGTSTVTAVDTTLYFVHS